LVVLICVFAAVPATGEAHDLSMAPAAVAQEIPAQTYVFATASENAADRDSCPISSTHERRSTCSSTGICHAVGLVQDWAVMPALTQGCPELRVADARVGRDVAPLFHPPKTIRA
jgi:hypothetical protein